MKFGKMLTLTRSTQRASNKILIDQIFESIQGEGPSVGLPTIFLRVAICNRTCVWCDTGYSKHSYPKGAIKVIEMSVEDIAKNLRDNYDLSNRTICLTGGEPGLYWRSLVCLMEELKKEVRDWSVETNGEIDLIEWIQRSPLNCSFVVSPKLESSGRKSNITVATNYLNRIHYKFVVGSVEDIDELFNIISVLQTENDIFVQVIDNDPVLIGCLVRSPVFVSSLGDGDFSNQRKEYNPTRFPVLPVLPVTSVIGGKVRNRVRLSVQVHKILGML